MVKKNWIITAILLIFAITFIGCPPPGTETNTSALTAKIAEAEALRDSTAVSADGSDVPFGQEWVKQTERTAFDTAIAAAKAALNGNQSIVDAAVIALNDAVVDFQNAKTENGYGTAISYTALNEAIARAQSERAKVTTAQSAENVVLGRKWVTAEVMETFDTAIAEAESALTTASAQDEINNAVTALNDAIDTFINAQEDGEKDNVDEDELSDLIAEAASVKEGVAASENGNDISPLKEWVSQSVLTALTDAIIGAEEAIEDAGDYNAVYIALTDAMLAFRDAKTPGTPTTTVKAELNSVISTANNAKANVATAENASTVPVGTYWVTSGQMETFNTAIDSANGTFNNEDAAYNTVSGAITALNAATDMFNSAKAQGSYTGETHPELGIKIGELSGKITLNDIPDGASVNTIVAYGDGWQSSSFGHIAVTGTSGQFDWTMPLYEGNKFSAGKVRFNILIWFGENESMWIAIPGSVDISSQNQGNIILGAVSLKSIVLSGTINISMNGSKVPSLVIDIYDYDTYDRLGETVITPDDTTANWSIRMLSLSSQRRVRFDITGWGDGEELLFNVSYEPANPLYIHNIDVSNILIDIGELNSITLSGTIDVSIDGQSVPYIVIDIYSSEYGDRLGSTMFAPNSTTSQWEITFLYPNNITEVEFDIRIFSDDTMDWEQRLFGIWQEPVSIDNESKSNMLIDIGKLNLITLSGTIDVSIDGQSVPYIVIDIHSQGYDGYLAWTSFAPNDTISQWEKTFAYPDNITITEVEFYIRGFSDYIWGEQQLFETWYGPLTINSEGKDISLDLGDNPGL